MAQPDTFFQQYVAGELDLWITDALEVMRPGDPDWRDGVRYLRVPSLGADVEDCISKFINLRQKLTDVHPSSGDRLRAVAVQGQFFPFDGTNMVTPVSQENVFSFL